VETAKPPERRRKARGSKQPTNPATLWVERRDGGWSRIAIQVQDIGELGIGIMLGEMLRSGMPVLLDGAGLAAPDGGRARGHVAWCSSIGTGVFRAGISLEDTRSNTDPAVEEFEDFYETLEVNPVASADTIHKIYRVLAHRFHPDNPESGSEELFKRLNRAYRVLSNPEQRAAFDVVRSRASAKQWRIFDPESAAPGLEQEQRKRRAILAVLYHKRMRQPEGGGVTIPEMEQLIAVPREHLEFPLWFLKEQGWILRTDGGKHIITAKGVEHAESTGAWQPPMSKNSGLLASAKAASV
jgi:hypothetical protein